MINEANLKKGDVIKLYWSRWYTRGWSSVANKRKHSLEDCPLKEDEEYTVRDFQKHGRIIYFTVEEDEDRKHEHLNNGSGWLIPADPSLVTVIRKIGVEQGERLNMFEEDE